MRVKIHETMKQTFVNKQEASKKKARWKQNHKVDCFKKFTNHFANFYLFRHSGRQASVQRILSNRVFRFVVWHAMDGITFALLAAAAETRRGKK